MGLMVQWLAHKDVMPTTHVSLPGKSEGHYQGKDVHIGQRLCKS